MRGYYNRGKIVVNLGFYFPVIYWSTRSASKRRNGVKGGEGVNRYLSQLRVSPEFRVKTISLTEYKSSMPVSNT